jgi:predicted enzyme related to lactoylglutathione lyase
MKKNAVAHFEIYANDPAQLSQFYTSLFDWSTEPVPGMDYRMVKTVDMDSKGVPSTPGGINGGIVKRPPGFEARSWVNYVNVESVDAAVERAQKLGAKVMRGRSAVPGMGWFAMLVDPEGNSFAVWQRDPSAK